MLSHPPQAIVPSPAVLVLPRRAQDLLARLGERDLAGHAHRVAALATGVAAQLGLDGETAADVVLAALLHDVGKLRVAHEVLERPGPLTPAEWALVRRHPVHGERMLARVPGLGHLAPVVRGHHEHFDGSGYPDGLAGDAIPLGARIVLVCDAFDAMTSTRAYRPARSAEDAMEELWRRAGTQFDPTAVTALAAHLSTRRGYARRVRPRQT